MNRQLRTTAPENLSLLLAEVHSGGLNHMQSMNRLHCLGCPGYFPVPGSSVARSASARGKEVGGGEGNWDLSSSSSSESD